MAKPRRLPSGLWQATVRLPSGKRVTHTDRLKSVVQAWEADLRAELRRGNHRDPRAGRITIADWYARWEPTRGIQQTTRVRDESRWRMHCEPRWAKWPMDSITRLEAQAWVRDLERTPWSASRRTHRGETHYLGPETVIGCASLMHQLYKAAMREYPPIVTYDPFATLDLPTIPPRPIRFYEHDEADALIAAVAEDRWRVLIELGMWVGLRWQELAGLSGDRVDWLRNEATVTHVWTPFGIRAYPKSKRSYRTVPVPEWIVEDMSRLMRGRPRESLVFVGDSGALSRSRFYQDAWYPAIKASGVPRHTPHVMRHTAASWLVQDGVSLEEVQKLLGHESAVTTARYANLRPGASEVIRASWQRGRGDTGQRRKETS